MTWRNSAWHGGFKWIALAIIVMFIAILVGAFLDESQSTTDRIVVGVSLVATMLLLLVMHNWITIRPGEVRIGYFPFYRRTLPMSEIQDVSIVDIRPVGQFGGWGVKGMARSKHGLLLGGHPSRGLRFETFDDHRYVVTFPDLEPIVQALADQSCTLSAGHGDETSGRV